MSEGSFTIDNFTAGPANNMVYTIKLNSSGERIWSMFGAANNGHNFFTDLALSNNENSIYVTGGSYDSFAYGSNSQSIGNGANTGLSALFFELSTSNGAVGSVITTGGTNCNCVAEQVIIDDSNNIYVAGIHAGTLDLTNDIGQSFASKGSYDIFVWKDFVPTAAISIGSESNDFIHDLKFDSNVNLLLGIKYGSSFDVSNNFSLTSENENAIIKVNSSLQFLLGYEIPNSSGSTISNIAVSQNGTIYSNYGNSSGSKIEKLDTNLNSLGKVEFVDNSQDFSSANLVGDLGIYLSNLSISPNDNLYLISSLFNRIQLKEKGKEILKSKDTTSDLFLLRLDSNLNY